MFYAWRYNTLIKRATFYACMHNVSLSQSATSIGRCRLSKIRRATAKIRSLHFVSGFCGVQTCYKLIKKKPDQYSTVQVQLSSEKRSCFI